MSEKTWAIDDLYYSVHAEIGGNAWDVECEPCETEQEAIDVCRNWLSDLTEHERCRASAWVRQMRVTDIEEDGCISGGVSTDRACWCDDDDVSTD